jgi:LacI family transcriptional regulator
MTVTMKDIARGLGLSTVTISKVLRNNPDISEKTRERVLQRVKELNYQPNLMARGLVTGRSYLLGLIVPDLLHPFFAEIAKALSAALDKKGYSLIISSSEEDSKLEEKQISQLLGRKLDALVIATSSTATAPFARLVENGVPFVFIDRRPPEISGNFVGIDDEAVGTLATEHLIGIGCRRIAHIRGPENSSPAIGRLKGYQAALARHGLKGPEKYIIYETKVDVESHQRGAEATRQLLKLHPRPDGIFCFNDPLAMGAIDTVLDAGLRVPDDIAIIGCGNLHYDRSLRVPLSSVDQRTAELGERTAKLAMHLIEAKTSPKPKAIILEPRLIERSSTVGRKAKRQG